MQVFAWLAAGGHSSEDGLLVPCVAVGRTAGTRPTGIARVEHRQAIVAIAVATPSPVNVEKAVAIVTVAKEHMPMSVGIGEAVIDDGVSGGQLVVYFFLPVGTAVLGSR